MHLKVFQHAINVPLLEVFMVSRCGQVDSHYGFKCFMIKRGFAAMDKNMVR